MAYVQAQVLVDTPTRHVAKRVNSATVETDQLFVNVSSLSAAVFTLGTVASANNFLEGETITAQAGGTAVVQKVINSTALALHSPSGTFTTAQTLTGATTGKVRTQNGSVANSAWRIAVDQIVYNVFGGAGTTNEGKVELSWQADGITNARCIAVLSGAGILDLKNLGMRANNNANGAGVTGNITISTLLFTSNSSYTLFVDCSKGAGFAPVSQDNSWSR